MSESHHSSTAPHPDPKVVARIRLLELAKELATQHRQPALVLLDQEVAGGEVLSYVILIDDADLGEIVVGELVNPET